MTACFAYPKAARFGRVVPKSRIYEASGASPKLRQRFVDQVDQIRWEYKLAPETLNLEPGQSVTEIQVFSVRQKTPAIDHDVLRAIDKAIGYPIIFELLKGSERKPCAAYKRQSDADHAKYVVSEYFEGEWESVDKAREPLPSALNLGALYDRLLSGLIPGGKAANEPIQERVARAEAIHAKEREIARIKARLAREKQFNKRVAINADLRKATHELKSLSGESLGQGDMKGGGNG
jgi:hypothetical protein